MINAILVVTTAVALSTLLTVLCKRGQARAADPVSGPLTAASWRRRAGRAVATACRQGGSVAVLVIDLDRFSRIDQVHGRRAGDMVLRAIARLIRVETGPDLVSRAARDEFVVLTLAASPAELAERIRARTEDLSIRVRARACHVTLHGFTVSVGVAVYPDDGQTLDQLILAANTLRIAAKDNGRNRVHSTRPGFRAAPEL